MSPLVEELPNLEAAVNLAIAGTAFDGTDGPDEIRAYSSIPKKGNPYPCVISMRLGGTPAEKHVLDAARIQVEAWGEKEHDKSTVLNLARAAWKALLEAGERGDRIELSDDEVVFFTSVEPELGLQWLPDPSTGRPRYIFAMRVYARSSVPAS